MNTVTTTPGTPAQQVPGEQRNLSREQKEAVGLLSIGTFLEYFDLLQTRSIFHIYIQQYHHMNVKHKVKVLY